jgi:hypothetical protein
MIASLAVESGISPVDLLQLEPRLLWTIQRYLVSRNQEVRKKRR